MHIVLDLLHIRCSFYTGIARMAFNLVKGFREYTNWQVSLLVWSGVSEFVINAIGSEMPLIVLPDDLQTVSKLRRGICPNCVKDVLGNYKIDVILTTCYTISSYIYPKAYRQIAVVHDMQPFKNALNDNLYFRALRIISQSVMYYRIVPYVVTISDFVRRDIMRYSGREALVIYNSVHKNTVEERCVKEIDNKPYILDLNSFLKYKNPEKLILAFCAIKDQIPHYLYLKGVNDNQGRYEELTKFIKEHGVEDRVILDISDRPQEEMNYLYHHASLFVSPSLMEGFGLTPIEAALYKVPILVSNIETLLEVTDGLVGNFDPKSVESISNAMKSALQNPPSLAALENIAAHFREKYSLKRQMESYIRLIESVVKTETR